MPNSQDPTALRLALANAVDTVSDAVIMLNGEQRIVFFNQGAERIFGHSASDILSKPLDLLIPSRFVNGHRKGVHALTGSPDGARPMGNPLRVRGRRADGIEFPAEGNISKLTQAGETVFVVILRDVSMRMQAEESLQKWGRIFERAGWGVVVVSADGVTMERPNAAFARMHGCKVEELIGRPITDVFTPETRHEWWARTQGAGANDRPTFESTHLRQDGSTFPASDGLTAIKDEDEAVLYYVVDVQDITERKQWENALKEHDTRLRVVIELMPLGVWILDEAGRVLFVNEEGKRLELGLQNAATALIDQWVGRTNSAGDWTGSRGRAVMRAISEGLATFDEILPVEYADGTSGTVLNSAVPIHGMNQRITGVIQIAQDVSELARVRRSLEERAEQHTRGLSDLLEVPHEVSDKVEVRTLLDSMLTELKRVIDCDGATVAILESGDLRIVDYQGPVPREAMLQFHGVIDETLGYQRAIAEHKPTIIDEIWRDPDWLALVEKQGGDEMRALFGYAHSMLVVPLATGDELIGVLTIDSAKPNHFTEVDVRLALALANQAAVAIENVLICTEAQRMAALEERQRLARELHDSVSQVLYSMGLGAKTALAQLERDPAQAAAAMDYVSRLAERGSAEMGALIFGLRSDSLQEDGLIVGLAKQASAVRARHMLDVQARFGDEPDISLEKKEGLYRIAGEALHNIVKHARASRVAMVLERGDQAVVLEITDDGVGYDPSLPVPGHLGLRSMRERTASIGGRLTIESKPGAGTRVRIEIPND